MNHRPEFSGNNIVRKEPCRICGALDGVKIAETDFWDLQHCDIVQCSRCKLIQLDPMITAANTSKGCTAYYFKEISEIELHEQKRNLIRNYRRGIVFALSLRKKGYHPKEILEFGPGSGYFSAGVQSVFPDCRITVADIVEEVLKENEKTHHFNGLYGSPEDIHIFGEQKFDLIIGRDILEHVGDIGKVIRNIHNLLKPAGLFHFITPNGKEDVWGHHVQWKIHHTASELLINHVNYFDGQGLLDLLTGSGFSKGEYYTYQVKYYFRGMGRQYKQKLAKPVSRKLSAGDMIDRVAKSAGQSSFNKREILNGFLFNHGDAHQVKSLTNKRIFFLTGAYCRLKHYHLIHLDPERNIGHEIHGLFIKNK
jgi:2-polyprenyl-3-methyl-5-hydroxy-6-metoxy-1,4-benzoquinol methylase